MRRHFLALALSCLLPTVAAAEVTTLLVNARVHTGADKPQGVEYFGWNEQGVIQLMGSGGDPRKDHPSARIIDAGGRHVVPGLIDAHGHVMNLGFALLRADLVDAKDKQEVIARLREFEKTLPEDAWLLGRGWDQNDWPGKQFPTAADLDAAFPDRPVWLERVDGHAGWANSAALRAVTRDLSGDWQPDGGRILREGGRATGVFIDTAAALVDAVVPAPDASLRAEALERSLQAAVAHGLTGVHDMGVSLADLRLMRRFADAGRLPLRIRAYADGNGAMLDVLCALGTYEHPQGRLAMRGVKFYVDGALGSRGAALLEDYSDEPGHRGLLVTEPAAYAAGVAKARDCGIQPASHAIGDRGNRIVLDTYAAALGDKAGTDHRWRVEHAQVVAPSDIPRFATLKLIASMQPTHATSDMPWAEARVGAARLEGAYAWQRMRAAGVALALGSDYPVESVDPRLGLYSSVTRSDLGGQPAGGWLPDQKLTPLQALEGFTTGAAFASFDEALVGKLALGHRADFVILGADPLTMPSAELPQLPVLSTWVDGRAVFEAGKSAAN
ncbi:MAG: amidohydrolase family protein [Arenimonas sp.]|uniref:amidohydrolase n=1 Tax=Arenimonas sp. TaxID=1872635 RepID=UPI0025C0CC42|nr:amidohydrolase family protein [Arenimonas sp.]MBW8366295.1 amidohydrolase family protein [Arenimonas sp.]